MKNAILGTYSEGGDFRVDISRLIDTRLIAQASSGGGKSWLLRKLIEEIHGQVQVIVLDIEGEFSTLREKYDFVVAGKGGDIGADPRYAEQLARKILETKADLICDLYELKQHERIRFVKLFLDAMVNAPKELWHPVVVILDEAHLFAPEKVQSESLSAVTDMMSRGRKRGYCLIPATQRPAKINKDVVAEAQNKLIGLGNTDIDRERGAKELGFTEKAKILSMRDLEPGQFYAVGPAFSKRGANLVSIGKVKTRHPESGSGKALAHAPTPTPRVKAILAKLVDLPKEAEQEVRDVAELRAKVRTLEREAKTRPVDSNEVAKAEARGRAAAEREFRATLDRWVQAFGKIRNVVDWVDSNNATAKSATSTPPRESVKQVSRPINYQPSKRPPVDLSQKEAGNGDNGGELKACERKILGFLNLKPGTYFTKVQVGAMTGYRHSSGGFNNALSKLAQAGLISRQGGSIALTNMDISHLVLPHQHRLEDWVSKLKACERKIYELLLEHPDTTFDKDELGSLTHYSPGSGGFNNAISRLSTLGLIKRVDGQIGINPEVML